MLHPVWDPYPQKNIAKIEAVQRRAARFVLNRFRNTSSVNNMLEALDWAYAGAMTPDL